MGVLWRGSLATRARIASGLVLFAFALAHLLNHALGLVSLAAMEAAQDWREVVTRSLPGSVVLGLALLVHVALTLGRLAGRRTLRMPGWEAARLILGLAIPFLLVPHLVETRAAALLFGVNDSYAYILLRLDDASRAVLQVALMTAVWTHGCIGLHYWLRQARAWRRILPGLLVAAVLIPAAALTGVLAASRELAVAMGDPAARITLEAALHLPGPEGWATLDRLRHWVLLGAAALVGATLAIVLVRRLIAQGGRVEITYVDGPKVVGARGMTLLEIAQANGIPHVGLCGGRGRCTTCRVVVHRGGQHLAPPEGSEAEVLAAAKAEPGARLACRIRPRQPMTVLRIYSVSRNRLRAESGTGEERRMAVLFLDMRGFTARTSGQMPFDVVFLLNRFFNAVVPAITRVGGRVDKYLGDGFLAIFDLPAGPASSCRAALEAVVGIDAALTRFNATLATEGAPPVRIGIGLHTGELVLGDIGATGHADATIVGEAVNAAARLEALTKEMRCQVLISRPVLDAAAVDVPPAAWRALALRGVAGRVEALALGSGAELLPWIGPSRAA